MHIHYLNFVFQHYLELNANLNIDCFTFRIDRYQYHKRIRSDTGNTLINPLEKAYDRDKMIKSKTNKMNNPSFVKVKTNISTPLVYSEDQRSSVIEK